MGFPGRICARVPFGRLPIRRRLTRGSGGRSVRFVGLSSAVGGRRAGVALRLRHFVSALAVLAIGALVALHVAVLWERVSQGRLADPAIALRWLGGTVLIAALLALRRLGVPLLWGRQALVFWMLVVLLHAGAAAPEAPVVREDPATLVFVLPTSAAPLGLVLVLLVAQLLRRSADTGPDRSLTVRPDRVSPRPQTGFLLALAPRGPPA